MTRRASMHEVEGRAIRLWADKQRGATLRYVNPRKSTEISILQTPIPRASDQQDARPVQAVGVVADPGSLTGCSVGLDSSPRAG